MTATFNAPYGCAWCGVIANQHGRRWHPTAGMHSWTKPTQAQIKDRMQDRRNARTEETA